MLKSSFQEPFLIGIYRTFVYIKVHMWWMRQSTLIHTLTNTLFNLHTRQQQSSRRYAIFFFKKRYEPDEKKTSEKRVRSVWTLGSNYGAITKIHAHEKSPTDSIEYPHNSPISPHKHP